MSAIGMDFVPETTATRLLRLLPLLTSRHTWPAADLADKLGVTTRTIRRDIERLRDLGYRVHATPGAHGGYTLSESPFQNRVDCCRDYMYVVVTTTDT